MHRLDPSRFLGGGRAATTNNQRPASDFGFWFLQGLGAANIFSSKCQQPWPVQPPRGIAPQRHHVVEDFLPRSQQLRDVFDARCAARGRGEGRGTPTKPSSTGPLCRPAPGVPTCYLGPLGKGRRGMWTRRRNCTEFVKVKPIILSQVLKDCKKNPAGFFSPHANPHPPAQIHCYMTYFFKLFLNCWCFAPLSLNHGAKYTVRILSPTCIIFRNQIILQNIAKVSRFLFFGEYFRKGDHKVVDKSCFSLVYLKISTLFWKII